MIDRYYITEHLPHMTMNWDYFILVCIASIGVYQIASIHAGLKGLWFFPWPKVQYVFGFLLIAGAFIWFFLSKNRNYQHSTEGSQQLFLFLCGIFAAYIFTAVISSFIQAKVKAQNASNVRGKQYEIGVETLKETTILGGIISSIKKSRKDKN